MEAGEQVGERMARTGQAEVSLTVSVAAVLLYLEGRWG